MEQQHTDPIDSDNTTGNPGGEPLSDYVQRMETDENLLKLAFKLKEDPGKPVENEQPEISKREVSKPDLSFEKFEAKRRQSDGQ